MRFDGHGGPAQPNIVAAKAALRQAAAARRRAISPDDARDAAERAAAMFLAAVPLPATGVVSGFWPVRGELDPRPLLGALRARGLDVALPIVAAPGHALVFRQWTLEVALVPGVMKIPVPPPEAAELTPDLLIVPLLAFDRAGFRLGYGGGYYDRTLAALRQTARPPTAVGWGFASQQVESVPHDDTDQPMNWLVSDRTAFEVA